MAKAMQSKWRAVYNGRPVTVLIEDYKNYYTCNIRGGGVNETKTFTTQEEFDQFINSLSSFVLY